MFRKGTTLIRKSIKEDKKSIHTIIPLNVDIIGDAFWRENPEILDPKLAKKKESKEKESWITNLKKILN